jgi:hypothetical protein
MFKKVCFSPESGIVGTCDHDEVVANPKIVDRFTKLAKSLRSIAPKSDDFLYFSIIFLKSAESSLLADDGSIKKVGNEDAWGFFDENWKWHGNVLPHRNNNYDIFPESELKLATEKWVGLPLCRDHESSSVDGIRGIILDTHYDEKFKQVVGLCALDKVNYPDLARKVETGMVRYGSMGTAVETSICTECSNRATNQNEYCDHISKRVAHGEINVGLNPIEYSLVVQPAEPGAILLKCIASLNEYKSEFSNYGVDNVSEMLGALSLKQAEHLDGIMKVACGDAGCSIDDREKIVKSFLSNNGLLKSSNVDDQRNFAEVLNAAVKADDLLRDPVANPLAKQVAENTLEQLGEITEEPRVNFSSGENSDESDPGAVRELGAASSRIGLTGSGAPPHNNDNAELQIDGDILGGGIKSLSNLSNTNPSSGEAVAVSTNKQANVIGFSNSGNDNDRSVDNVSINSIMEDIMNESRLRKRAELRRRIAYMQGGAEGAEPNTYKSEDFDRNKDKQMHQDGNMGGADGMVPGDSETKEKMSRAELEERRLRRLAYMQGGAEGAEPNTYKSEDFDRNKDKQMHQDGNMGGADGMVPGDSETKEKMSRAELAYNGPGLSTRFTVKRGLGGGIDKAASLLEVFSGNTRVIAATGSDIFGPELDRNWEWLNSREYGKEVCDQIRTSGLKSVAGLLKAAQELEEAPMDDLPELPELPELPAEEDLPALDAPEALPMDDEPMDDDEDPAQAIDDRLGEMEGLLDEVRDFVGQLQDERMADVDVNVFTGKGEEGETEQVDAGLGALAGGVVTNLKAAYRKLDNSADELSIIAETYENINKLSAGQRAEFVKLSSQAVREADQITGEAKALMRVASSISTSDEATTYAETATNTKADAATDSNVSELVASAMDLRRERRAAILKQAEQRVAKHREAIVSKAQEAIVAGEEHEEADEAADHLEGEAEVAENNMMDMANDHEMSVKAALSQKLEEKKAEEVRESYRVKLRRAYDVGMDMQRKGLLPTSKAALDRQVDEIMTFDDNAFESFKRSIANARAIGTVKIASDLGGVNIGVEGEAEVTSTARSMNADTLSSLWE